MNDFVDNNETKPNVCRGGRSLRMSQLLRASLVNVSDSRPPEAVLNHFSHRHPLLRLHLLESEGIKCSFCNNIISDWAYVCEKHCDHYLHEVCSNFPREIRHDFHPLLCLSPFKATSREQFHCSACGDGFSDHPPFKSYYCCDSCNFNLHVDCASIPMALYQKVKYPLHLFLSFPITSEAPALFCYICMKEIPTLGCWMFYNHDHDYLCHFDCAAVTEYATDNDSMGKLQNRLQTLSQLTALLHCLVNRVEMSPISPMRAMLSKKSARLAPKILTLLDNVSYELFVSFPFNHEKAEIDCNICSDVVVIKDGLFYYNLERNKALHVYCAVLEESGCDTDKIDVLSIQRLKELRIV